MDVKRITKWFTKTNKNDNESQNVRLNSREREREITVLQVAVDRCSIHGRLVQQKDTYNPDICLLRIFQTGRCSRTLFSKSPYGLCTHWFVSGKTYLVCSGCSCLQILTYYKKNPIPLWPLLPRTNHFSQPHNSHSTQLFRRSLHENKPMKLSVVIATDKAANSLQHTFSWLQHLKLEVS